jgi:isopentenyl-diphosphate Delta-isomerase
MKADFLDSLRPSWSFASRPDNAVDRVMLVDSDDRPIGTMDKLDAHRQGVRHRAVSVILRDSHGNLLLQQRAADKYHSPSLWSNTCCSHPRPDETPIDAACRRLREEMGISCALSAIFTAEYRAIVSETLIENEIVHVFAGQFAGSPDPDPAEVGGWRWMASTEVAEDVDRHPDRYTVWFRIYRRQFWGAMAG